MSTNARWMIGLLIVLVIGLGIALLIVAGDNGDDGGDGETATLPSITSETIAPPTTTEAPTTTETTTTTTTVPTTTDGSGGVPAP